MRKKLSGLLGIILSIIIVVYFESIAYKILNLIGINVNNYSNIIRLIINVAIKLIMCFIIYIIFKRDHRSRRTKDNLIRTIFVFIVSLIAVVIGMYLFSYAVNFIGDIFNIEVLEMSFYNIFNKKLDFSLIVKIINDYIINPYLYCTIIILSADKLTRRTDTCIVLSGLLASIIYALSLSGTLGFVIINSLNMFLLFGILAFIYKKHFSIYFVITLYSFYLISNIFILNYIGW